MELIDVTQIFCPESGGRRGEDNATHYLIPIGTKTQYLACRYCKKSEAKIREEQANG